MFKRSCGPRSIQRQTGHRKFSTPTLIMARVQFAENSGKVCHATRRSVMTPMMNRRQFVKNSTFAAASLALPPARAAESAFKLNYIVGSAMYGDLPLATVIEETPKTGAQFLDVWPKKHGTQRGRVS